MILPLDASVRPKLRSSMFIVEFTFCFNRSQHPRYMFLPSLDSVGSWALEMRLVVYVSHPIPSGPVNQPPVALV